MPPLPIAAVVGATGTQGISIVTSLSKSYQIRALTRSPTSSSTLSTLKGLQNVLPTYFDLSDRSSVEKAFEGADLVYAMTTVDRAYMFAPPGVEEPTFGEKEMGKLMVDVAKEKGVGLFIWEGRSTFGPIGESVANAQDKPWVDKYLKESGLPSVCLDVGYFMENLISGDMVRPSASNSKELVFYCHYASSDKDKKTYPLMCIQPDLGRVVSLISTHFEKEKFNNIRFALSERVYSAMEMCEIISQVTGRKTILNSTTPVGPKDSIIDGMFKGFATKSYVPEEKIPDPILAKLGFKFTSFEEWCKEVLVPHLAKQGI